MHSPEKLPMYKRIILFVKISAYVLLLSLSTCLFMLLGYLFGILEWCTRTAGSYIKDVTDKLLVSIKGIMNK